MPEFVVAHRSGPHRLAATALYRALLSQCSKLDASVQWGQEEQQQLRNLIRCRFSAFRHTTSHRELKLLFEAGYEAVDHLDAAVAGEAKSAQYVRHLLRRAPRQAKAGPFPIARRHSISDEDNDPFGSASSARASPEERVPVGQIHVTPIETSMTPTVVVSGPAETSHEAALHDESPFTTRKGPRIHRLARPIPHEELGGTGRRQVPRIFSANSIPVLRFTKPQPPALTGFLNSRIKQRQKRHDLRHALEKQMPVAAQEDQWDAILHEHAGVGNEDSDQHDSQSVSQEPRWSREVWESLRQVNSYLDQEMAKNRSMAEKMYAVIDREAQLAEQERKDAEREKTGLNEGPEGLSDLVSDIIGASDSGHRSTG